MGKQWKQCQTLFQGAPKSLQMVIAAMKLKDAYSLEGKLWHIQKQRHYFVNKALSSQGYGFSGDHVWMWQLDCEESWTLKNWWVWVNSGSWWWTGRPGKLRFMGSQGVGHDWVTELNWTSFFLELFLHSSPVAQRPAVGARALGTADLSHIACGISPLGGGHH